MEDALTETMQPGTLKHSADNLRGSNKHKVKERAVMEGGVEQAEEGAGDNCAKTNTRRKEPRRCTTHSCVLPALIKMTT